MIETNPILQVALDLSASLGAEDRYQRLLATLRGLMPSDAAMICRLEDRVLRPVVFDGLRASVKDMRFSIDESPVFSLLTTSDEVVRISGGEIRKFRFYDENSEVADRSMGVLMGTALRVEGEVVGTLTTSAADPRAFDDVEDETVLAFAALAAAALRTADLIDALEKAAEHRQRVAQELQRDARKRLEGPLLGESDAVRRLRKEIGRHAATTAPLLLVGPAGTGKEAVARAIHAESPRAERAFIYVDCGRSRSDPHATLLGTARQFIDPESEARPGSFDLASGGTLFLDGIEELAPDTQEDLLVVLEESEQIRGGRWKFEPDARVIATTLARPDSELPSGLNPDLAALLSRNRIVLPRLAERREDIAAMVTHFVNLHARRVGKDVTGVSEDSVKRLEEYGWPGNIQELSNVVEGAVVATAGQLVEIGEASFEGGIPVGSYRLVERLGVGGMGEVWKAKHKLLARPAAVKLIRSDTTSGRSVERFHREANTTANLRSPHTVQLFDFGISDTGSFYYVMELLEGMDFDQLVRKFGPVSAARSIALLRQACSSLAEAHESGLVHRDIKPANLYACRLGNDHDFVKVLDFGMVKTVVGNEPQLTADGQAGGTPAFIPPELALGETDVDGRADLYSMGCVAYWLLTGTLVFDSPSATRMIMDHVQTEPTPPSRLTELSIPPELDEVVLACLAKSPDRRPASASELSRRLGDIPLQDPWTPEQAERWWKRHMPDLGRD